MERMVISAKGKIEMIELVAAMSGLRNYDKLFVTGAVLIPVSGGGCNSLVANRCPILGVVDPRVEREVLPGLDIEEKPGDSRSLLDGMKEWVEWATVPSAKPTIFVADTLVPVFEADLFAYMHAIGDFNPAPEFVVLQDLMFQLGFGPADRPSFEQAFLSERARFTREQGRIIHPFALAWERAELAVAALRAGATI